MRFCLALLSFVFLFMYSYNVSRTTYLFSFLIWIEICYAQRLCERKRELRRIWMIQKIIGAVQLRGLIWQMDLCISSSTGMQTFNIRTWHNIYCHQKAIHFSLMISYPSVIAWHNSISWNKQESLKSHLLKSKGLY